MHSIFDAWDKNLEFDGYHAQAIRAFGAEYQGRGPEVTRR